MTLSDDKKAMLFKMMAEKPMYEVGVEFGLDKHYKDVRAVKNAVYRIYNQVRMNPSQYLLSQEVVDMVVSIVSSRNIGKSVDIVPLREKQEAAQTFEAEVMKTRDLSMKVLQKKLEIIGSSKKLIKETNLSALAQAAGILFDKGQIIKGQSTENIAVMGKIDPNISAEDAIQMVIRMREANQIDKDRTVKRK